MVVTRGHISGRIEDDGTDSKGRWNWVQLTGENGEKVLIISAYRVSQQYPMQQGTLLPLCNGTEPISKII